MKKLLKFDIIHPPEYLQQKIKSWSDLDALSLEAYRERLIALRSNYSDYYTYHLNQSGDWQAEEFFLLDPIYLEKAAKEVLGSGRFLLKLKAKIAEKVFKKPDYYRDQVIQHYVAQFKPDVIFVRSQPIPSSYWQRFRHNTLLVSRLSARQPKRWHPNDWDLIYTDQPDFKTFFELHGVDTIINDQGFDMRVPEELHYGNKKYDCSFIGGLGTQNFLQRTEFINSIAEKTEFTWWGYWWNYGGDGRKLADFPALESNYKGFTSGLEMYQTFADSKISLNDYVDTANGIGFNQRMFEVMGVGAFLLTRWAPNFEKTFPPDIFVTYKDTQDCLEKIAYYLKNEKEREEIAAAGKRFIKENYDYSRITAAFAKNLEKRLAE